MDCSARRMPPSKSLVFAALVVELHRVLQAGGAALAAIGARGQVAQDLRRAGFLFRGVGRTAGEDLLAAHRLRHAGHRVRSDDGEVAHVREGDGAVAVAALGGVLDRREQVVRGPFEALDERGGDALRAGLDVDGRRPHLHPVLTLVLPEVRLGHRRGDVEERDALAVDRDVQLLGEAHGQERLAAEQPAERGVDHRGLDHVLAVRGEHVDDGDAAAGADGRAGGADHLVAAVLDLEGGGRGAGGAIADGQAADLAGRAQVALHQLRREALDVGDVVEAGADGVGREPRGDVHLEAEEVLDGGGVLRAIQPLERTPSGTRRGGGRLVHRGLERVHHRHHGRIVRARRAGGRHHAGAKLADDLLGELAVLVDLRGVEVGEHEAAGLGAGGVAGGAVLPDQFVLGGDRHGRGGRRCDVRRGWFRNSGRRSSGGRGCRTGRGSRALPSVGGDTGSSKQRKDDNSHRSTHTDPRRAMLPRGSDKLFRQVSTPRPVHPVMVRRR